MKSRKIIAGIDEVGRGSLIGSVYSAAVIFNDGELISNLTDSKKITAKNRSYLANIIIDKAAAVSIGIATRDEIDDLNIHHATPFIIVRVSIPVSGAYLPSIKSKSALIGRLSIALFILRSVA